MFGVDTGSCFIVSRESALIMCWNSVIMKSEKRGLDMLSTIKSFVSRSNLYSNLCYLCKTKLVFQKITRFHKSSCRDCYKSCFILFVNACSIFYIIKCKNFNTRYLLLFHRVK